MELVRQFAFASFRVNASATSDIGSPDNYI